MPEPMSAVVASDLELRHGRHVALARSSVTVPSGRSTAVIGPNGSGKSTFLDAIVGLVAPSGGDLVVLGQRPREVRRRVAYVPQSTKVNDELPITVTEAVALGRYATLGFYGRFGREERRLVVAAMERLDLASLGGRHLSELSGGQRQRVFVAQGIVQDRDLLLLDEPMTGLDLTSAAVISAVIAEEREAGRTVILTTHDLGDASAADHVILLAGRVVAAGPPAEVLTAEHLADAYGLRIARAPSEPFVDDAAHRPTAEGHVQHERHTGTNVHEDR